MSRHFVVAPGLQPGVARHRRSSPCSPDASSSETAGLRSSALASRPASSRAPRQRPMRTPQGARRDLPARRRRRAEHGRALRRARLLRVAADHRRRPARRRAHRHRARSRRLLRPASAHGAARAVLGRSLARHRPCLRIAGPHAIALRRAGLHGERHARREAHRGRLAQSLPARAGRARPPHRFAQWPWRRNCRGRCRARRRRWR